VYRSTQTSSIWKLVILLVGLKFLYTVISERVVCTVSHTRNLRGPSQLWQLILHLVSERQRVLIYTAKGNWSEITYIGYYQWSIKYSNVLYYCTIMGVLNLTVTYCNILHYSVRIFTILYYNALYYTIFHYTVL